MPLSENKPPEETSKSSIKRKMTALQKIGEALVDMQQSQLNQIPLPDQLLEAILVARTLKAGEPKRRQLQHVGKLMRHIDVEPVHADRQTLRQLVRRTQHDRKMGGNTGADMALFRYVKGLCDQLDTDG